MTQLRTDSGDAMYLSPTGKLGATINAKGVVVVPTRLDVRLAARDAADTALACSTVSRTKRARWSSGSQSSGEGGSRKLCVGW